MTSLLTRTKPEYYDEYRERGLQLGANPRSLERQIQIFITEARSLLAGKCPKCGAPSARYVDYQRQQGGHSAPGAWVQYRCSTQEPPGTPSKPGTCDFMVDYIEHEAAN